MTEANLVKPLVALTDPILRQRIEKFNFASPSHDPTELAHTLAQTMIFNKGIALSAPQIGIPARAFVLLDTPIMCCFNPMIVDESDETLYTEEGSLLAPNFLIKVKRPIMIKIRYTQANGEVVTSRLRGISARLYQQQVDQLDGKLFTENCTRLAVELAIRKANKRGMNYQQKDFM